jgi:hypothetical protein
VGGTAEGVETPDAPNVNVVGAFPVSGFEFPVPDTAPKEKNGFADGADIFPGANDIDLVLPVSGAFAAPLENPNSAAELAGASFGPRFSVPALALGLMSETAGAALGLPLLCTPNIEEERPDGANVELEAVALGFVTDGTDELIDWPKPNEGFGGLGGAGAAGGLDREVLGGLVESPKLNFGFCESPAPTVEGTAKLLPLVVVEVELEGCGNEKVPRDVAPEPSP